MEIVYKNLFISLYILMLKQLSNFLVLEKANDLIFKDKYILNRTNKFIL